MWKEESILACEFQEYDTENQFLDNFPAAVPGSIPTLGPKVRLNGQKWLFHIGNFTAIRLARKNNTPILDPILDACKKGLPHAYSEDKFFVYPVVCPNKDNRIVLDSFRTRSNNYEIKETVKTPTAGMFSMVTGKEEPETTTCTLLNVDRDELAALKRAESLWSSPESHQYLLEKWTLPSFEGQTDAERIDIHLNGEPSLSCTDCEARFGFCSVCEAHDVPWEDVKMSLEEYRDDNSDHLARISEGFKCPCGGPLQTSAYRHGVGPLSRWERSDNIREGCRNRAYSAQRVLAAKVKRKKVVQRNACTLQSDASQRRERRRRRLNEVQLNDF